MRMSFNLRTVVRNALLLLAIALVSACTTTVNKQIDTLKRPDGGATIVLMPLDVELYELSAAGVPEAKADWTEAARTHLLAAFNTRQSERNLRLGQFDEGRLTPEVSDRLFQVQKLHAAVGGAIMQNALPNMALPTKTKFDWTLGPSAAALREATGSDYALFTHVRDSYSSGGRVALIIAAAILGVGVPGGAQIGFASLVDLHSGDIVWFNRLARGTGDLRTAAAALETTDLLLTDFPR